MTSLYDVMKMKLTRDRKVVNGMKLANPSEC